MFKSVWQRSPVRLSVVVTLVILLSTGCASLPAGTGNPRSAKLPVPPCPPVTLTLEHGWGRIDSTYYTLSAMDRATLDAWVRDWQTCATQRGAVIEEANR